MKDEKYKATTFHGRTHARHRHGVKLISQWRLESLTCYLGNPARPKPLAVAFPHFSPARSIGRTTNYASRHTLLPWNIVIFLTLRDEDYRLSLFASLIQLHGCKIYVRSMPLYRERGCWDWRGHDSSYPLHKTSYHLSLSLSKSADSIGR